MSVELRETVRTDALVLNFRPAIEMTDAQFAAFCALNRDVRIEQAATGEVIIMSPTGGETGSSNARLNARLTWWAEADGTGETFDSSTGFVLPNGAKRSPDAAWVRKSRYDALTPEEKRRFPPLCPDFVVELRSASDDLGPIQDKLAEYIANGAQLGWLIDPIEHRVHLYRPNAEPEILDAPDRISGDPILPGFTLDRARLW